VVEPDLASLSADQIESVDVDAHSMDPVKILRLAASMGGPLKRVLLVGCEPATLGPEEGLMGLSDPVKGALKEAVALVESLIGKVLAGEWPGSQQ
jgi:hydrogenase maturation protease